MRIEKSIKPILDSAATEFLKFGYHGATTKNIAKAANVTQPLVYYHYQAKLDVFLACLNDLYETGGYSRHVILKNILAVEILQESERLIHAVNRFAWADHYIYTLKQELEKLEI